jgi:predicted O-methyltransferase YrrM
MHRDGLLVSIDLPAAENCGGQTDVERGLFSTFGYRGQRFEFIPSNSQFWTTRETLKTILGGRPIDLLFIDGDHSYGGVRSDFEMYGCLLAKTGFVAIHDINIRPELDGAGCDVGVFWDEVRSRFETEEIVDTTASPPERAWGIGLVRALHG